MASSMRDGALGPAPKGSAQPRSMGGGSGPLFRSRDKLGEWCLDGPVLEGSVCSWAVPEEWGWPRQDDAGEILPMDSMGSRVTDEALFLTPSRCDEEEPGRRSASGGSLCGFGRLACRGSSGKGDIVPGGGAGLDVACSRLWMGERSREYFEEEEVLVARKRFAGKCRSSMSCCCRRSRSRLDMDGDKAQIAEQMARGHKRQGPEVQLKCSKQTT